MTYCNTCGCDPCVNPSFCSASRKADRQIGQRRLPPGIPADWDRTSLDALWELLNRPRATPRVTIEAIVYSVRERGLAALKEPANIERLQRCDAPAKADINRSIASLLEAGVISS